MKRAAAAKVQELLLAKALAEHSVTRVFSFGATMAAKTGRKSTHLPRPESVMAVGVSPMKGNKDEFRVAVRAYPGHADHARAAVRELQIPKRELDIAYDVHYSARLTLQSGQPCGHGRNGVGTIGAFVRDSHRTYILSNNHVLANCGDCDLLDPIYFHGNGDPGQPIARLDHWIALRTGTFDAALACVDQLQGYPIATDGIDRRFYPGIGVLVPNPINRREAVTSVIKLGAETGVTRGTVNAYLQAVAVEYPEMGPDRSISFRAMIEFLGAPRRTPFSAAGDSGSLIIDRHTLRPYSLLVGGGAGEDGIDRTVGHFIPEVLAALGVRF